MLRRTTALLATLLATGFILAGCAAAPEQQSQRDQLHEDVQTTINAFIRKDPTIEQHFDDSYGYVVYPNIGKGGVGIGGAYGQGEVYEQGELIGYSAVTQGTIGLQFGGQSFSQVIFFRDRSAFDKFVQGQASFVAQASAVAATTGAAASTKFRNGVMIFVLTKGGMMGELAIGGQNFKFSPLRNGMPAAYGTTRGVYGTTPPAGRPRTTNGDGGELQELDRQQRQLQQQQQRLQSRLEQLEQQRQRVEEQQLEQQQQEMEDLEQQQEEIEQMREQLEQRRQELEQSLEETQQRQQEQQEQREAEQEDVLQR